MASEAPPFWYQNPGLKSALIKPIGWVYGAIAVWRMRSAPRHKINVPTICIGNFTVGGTGKTPTTISLAKAAIELGFKPGILTRGYGGSAVGPLVVDPGKHGAKYVGDEPLLLAETATTIVAKDRIKGAQAILDQGCDLLLMDDGFQSAHLWMDFALLAIDAIRGLGNGGVIPAGPVRAPLKDQMSFAHGLCVIGKGQTADDLVRITARSAKPVYNGLIKPTNAEDFKDKQCLAFAAIGDPEKFYNTLKASGADVQIEKSYPDHHYFTSFEVEELLKLAAEKDLIPVTTSKDYVRLKTEHGKSQELAEITKVLDVEFIFDDPSAPKAIIEQAVKSYRKRMTS